MLLRQIRGRQSPGNPDGTGLEAVAKVASRLTVEGFLSWTDHIECESV